MGFQEKLEKRQKEVWKSTSKTGKTVAIVHGTFCLLAFLSGFGWGSLLGEDTLAMGAVVGFIFVLLYSAYMIPYFLAYHRRHKSQAGVFALNLLLGWSLIAWVIALIWSLSRTGNEPA
jgi:hypothetical protein